MSEFTGFPSAPLAPVSPCGEITEHKQMKIKECVIKMSEIDQNGWAAPFANWLFKGWSAPQAALSNDEPPCWLKIQRHWVWCCFKISAALWLHSSKVYYRLHSASHWVSLLVDHKGRRFLSPFFFRATYFSPTVTGKSHCPWLPLRSRKKCLEFPYNLWCCVLPYLILPVLLSVQSQDLLCHPCAARFGPGHQGWGWLDTKNTPLPAPW